MIVPFMPGDGATIDLDVAYIAQFPRRADGTCAFCGGDPLAEESDLNTHIGAYFARNPRAEACPCCKGQAT